MAWTQFRQRNSGRTFPTASTSLRSRHHHRCHRARSFVVENVHTCSHVERPLPSDISNITLCSFAQPAFGEKKWYKIDSKMKAHRLFVLLNLSYVQASSDQEPLADLIFVFLQDQVGSLYLERKEHLPPVHFLSFFLSFPSTKLPPLAMHAPFRSKTEKETLIQKGKQIGMHHVQRAIRIHLLNHTADINLTRPLRNHLNVDSVFSQSAEKSA